MHLIWSHCKLSCRSCGCNFYCSNNLKCLCEWLLYCFFRSGWEFQICESYGTQKNEIKNDLKLRRSDSKRKQCRCGSIHWLLVRIGLDLWELHSEVEGDECELVSQLWKFRWTKWLEVSRGHHSLSLYGKEQCEYSAKYLFFSSTKIKP